MGSRAQKRLHLILIVEDDELIKLIAVDYLKEAGFDVLEARHATHALTLIEDATEAGVDLVFTDIQMPGNMDGTDLANYFLRHHPSVPVILTSGAKRPLLEAKHRRFIPKPYDLAEVEKHIRELVT